MTSDKDERLNGRVPEFSRMSNRPGIGAFAMSDVASSILEFNLEDRIADVPAALRHGQRLMPLGRYLRKRLRKEIGRDEKAPAVAVEEASQKVRELYEAADKAFTGSRSGPLKRAQVLTALTDEADQVERRRLAKDKIFRKKRTL